MVLLLLVLSSPIAFSLLASSPLASFVSLLGADDDHDDDDDCDYDHDDDADLVNRWTVQGRTWCRSRSAPSHHHRHHHQHDHNHDHDHGHAHDDDHDHDDL